MNPDPAFFEVRSEYEYVSDLIPQHSVPDLLHKEFKCPLKKKFLLTI